MAASNLKRGDTASCGCLQQETAAKNATNNKYRLTHGMSKTPEHSAWTRLHDKCYNPQNKKFPIYGARGINICQRWFESFENFYADMGPRPSPKHSIDRIDNDGNYEPGNCRWATPAEQSRNKRNNVFIEIDGVRLCIVDWHTKLNLPKRKAYDMVRTGRCNTAEEAIRELYHTHHR